MEKQLHITVTYNEDPTPSLAHPNDVTCRVTKVEVDGVDITTTKVVDPNTRPTEEYWQLPLRSTCDILDLRYMDNS